MNSGLPLVSVITPAYNRASFLDETIQSVLSQDYPHMEYIVIDDGSTDNTPEVLSKYNGRIYWESHPNMGETRTVNKGFAMAKGEIVCVVNSDDPLLPGAISTAVKVLQECPDALAAYPDWIEIGPNSEFIQELRLPNYDLFNMLTTFNVAIGPGTFIRRRAFDLVGMRDPQLKYTGDLEFWFRLALHGRLAHIPVPLATHRTHPESASITDRGARMADELVGLVEKVYAQRDLPPEILKERARVFSNAHRVAVGYCGTDRSAAVRHKVISMYHLTLHLVEEIATASRERDQLKRELTALVSSRSWRMTAPLRAGRKALDFLIARFRNPPHTSSSGRSGPLTTAPRDSTESGCSDDRSA